MPGGGALRQGGQLDFDALGQEPVPGKDVPGFRIVLLLNQKDARGALPESRRTAGRSVTEDIDAGGAMRDEGLERFAAADPEFSFFQRERQNLSEDPVLIAFEGSQDKEDWK
jgi:hypothetical protein